MQFLINPHCSGRVWLGKKTCFTHPSIHSSC